MAKASQIKVRGPAKYITESVAPPGGGSEEPGPIRPLTARWADDQDKGEILSLCGQCKHKWAGTFACTAFPRGIPEIIRLGEVQHLLPMPNLGQKGTEVFDQIGQDGKTFSMED